MTAASKNTVAKLLVELGAACRSYQDRHLRNLTTKRVQCDEIWSYVGAKQKQVDAGAKGEGDVWTWTAMDADSKLMISWLVGPRGYVAARAIMHDLHGRLANRVQLTADGLAWYRPAVEKAEPGRRSRLHLIRGAVQPDHANGYAPL